jgi:hypothetical protein
VYFHVVSNNQTEIKMNTSNPATKPTATFTTLPFSEEFITMILNKMPSGGEWFIDATNFLRFLGETEENIKLRLYLVKRWHRQE